MNAGMKREIAGALVIAAAVGFYFRRNRLGSSLLAAAAGTFATSLNQPESFAGQSVLVTGGSRGLGLALAERFAKEGAQVAILARQGEELQRAVGLLRERVPGARVMALTCDVTDSAALGRAIARVAHEQGGIDLLLNNAGAITVGPFEALEKKDFTAQIDLHLLAVVEACRFALPYLRRSEGRRIVNICSMGGRVAVPHMLPYDASKFALAGFSQGLMAELAGEGISVTTIFPALMRTGSPIQAVFKGDHEKEFAWFQAADVLPGFSLSADRAAEKIVAAARRRDAELVPSLPGKVRMVAASILPETFAGLMALLGRMMPEGKSKAAKTGAESRRLFDETNLLAPFRARAHEAEKRWNQEPAYDAAFALGQKKTRAISPGSFPLS